MKDEQKNWYIYIVKCADNSFYTGIAQNIVRRINEHNTSNSIGSKYIRNRRPVILVYKEVTHSKSLALKREAEIKRLSRKIKNQIINGSVAQR